MYDARVNVEVFIAVAYAMYLYEYFYEWHDTASAEVGALKTHAYLVWAYFRPQEAFFRIPNFELHGMRTAFPPRSLLEDEQIAHFRESDILSDISATPGKKRGVAA